MAEVCTVTNLGNCNTAGEGRDRLLRGGSFWKRRPELFPARNEKIRRQYVYVNFCVVALAEARGPLFMRRIRKIGVNPFVITNKNDSHIVSHCESSSHLFILARLNLWGCKVAGRYFATRIFPSVSVIRAIGVCWS